MTDVNDPFQHFQARIDTFNAQQAALEALPAVSLEEMVEAVERIAQWAERRVPNNEAEARTFWAVVYILRDVETLVNTMPLITNENGEQKVKLEALEALRRLVERTTPNAND